MPEQPNPDLLWFSQRMQEEYERELQCQVSIAGELLGIDREGWLEMTRAVVMGIPRPTPQMCDEWISVKQLAREQYTPSF